MSGEIQIFGFLARIIVEEAGFGYNLFNLAAIRPIVIAGNIDETNMIKYSSSPGNAIVLCYLQQKKLKANILHLEKNYKNFKVCAVEPGSYECNYSIKYTA